MEQINHAQQTPPRETPSVNRYEVLCNIKTLHPYDQKPVNKKQFEKMIDREKGQYNGDAYSETDLKAIYSMTSRNKSSPSLLEEDVHQYNAVERQYGKWYFWIGFICPIFWIIGGTYPSRGRTNRAYIIWRRRNRAAVTVFLTLLVAMFIIGLVLKPDFLGVRTSSSDLASPSLAIPNMTPQKPQTESHEPPSPNAPVNAADARPLR